MSYVLSNKWSFSRAPFIIQQWHPQMDLKKITPEKVAVWVRLGITDLQFWDTTILSKLASFIGIPLPADFLTATLSRIGFARVLASRSCCQLRPPRYYSILD